jgi:hypothetical protein
MKDRHPPWHWAAVAAALGFALLTLSDAHGQAADAAGGMRDTAGPAVPRDPGMDRPKGRGELAPQRDRDGSVIKRERAENPGKDVAPGKARRAAKRTVEKARRGVGGVDG